MCHYLHAKRTSNGSTLRPCFLRSTTNRAATNSTLQPSNLKRKTGNLTRNSRPGSAKQTPNISSRIPFKRIQLAAETWEANTSFSTSRISGNSASWMSPSKWTRAKSRTNLLSRCRHSSRQPICQHTLDWAPQRQSEPELLD